jgi:hypothetical protein
MFEKEFLSLAAIWLACRWQTMGNAVHTPWMVGCGELTFSLLGEHDYHQEMKLLCKEEREKRSV